MKYSSFIEGVLLPSSKILDFYSTLSKSSMSLPYQQLYDAQVRYFRSGATRPIAFRKEQLRKLEDVMRAHEPQIEEALHRDLRKHPQEVYTTEVGGVYEEIHLMLRKLDKWMRPKRVSHPLFLMPGRSRIYPEPLGNVLIISPWNYPVLLTFRVVVGAIAAGNTIIIKPSEVTSHTANVIAQIVNAHFPSEFMHVVNGDGAEVVSNLLLNHHFDHVFFTGSTAVGSRVMEMASRHLSPVSLELGGKSPCVIAPDANLTIAAKRIAWGKLVCSGQTCVAPDYLVVHESVKDQLIAKLIDVIEEAYGKDPQQSDSLARIINKKRFETLNSYLTEGRILYGGKAVAEDLYIAPTIMDQVSPDARVMKEEIFGPILPVFTYREKEEVLELIERNPYPLALYVFSSSGATQQYFIKNVRFGGGAINETVLQLGNMDLPFGGVSYSGHGTYLGKYTFDTFTHYKSILQRANWLEPSIRHAPFSSFKTNLWRRLLGRK
jgi:aldehyde dehydrogenase (NAD+)